MLAIHSALWGSTGSWEMFVFHTLSAGNIGQLGAPGSGVPADAGSGVAMPRTSPPHRTARTRDSTPSALVAGTARLASFQIIPRPRPYTDRAANAGFRHGAQGRTTQDAPPISGARRWRDH